MATSHYFPKISSKKPPDRAEPMQLSTPVAKKSDQEEKRLTDRYPLHILSKENTNRIVNTIKAQLQIEKDQEIILILSQQKEIFQEIQIYRETGQKGCFLTAKREIAQTGLKTSFKTTENEKELAQTQVQLQNQIDNLEKSVENKFNQILTSIETKYQDLSQNIS